MELNKAIGCAIKRVREVNKLTQEDFSDVSSRTYISSLERGLKSPTLKKIDELAGKMGVHPVTLILLAYQEKDPKQSPEGVMKRCLEELDLVFFSDDH